VTGVTRRLFVGGWILFHMFRMFHIPPLWNILKKPLCPQNLVSSRSKKLPKMPPGDTGGIKLESWEGFKKWLRCKMSQASWDRSERKNFTLLGVFHLYAQTIKGLWSIFHILKRINPKLMLSYASRRSDTLTSPRSMRHYPFQSPNARPIKNIMDESWSHLTC